MAKLTDEQERFVELYLEANDAAAAAEECLIDLALNHPKGGCYVYFILCPEMREILYVGKGTGKRMYQHVSDVKAGKVNCIKKYRALKEWIDQGRDPVPVVFEAGLSSDNALRKEKSLIFAIGPENLANQLNGATPSIDIAFERAKWLKRNLRSVCQWIRATNPKPEDWHYFANTRQQIDATYLHIARLVHEQ
jgi:hypothetical protein